MKKIVCFDLDGTLADGRHRLHLLPTKDYDKTESWTEFNLAAVGDTPIRDNIALCNSLCRVGYRITILTGRSDVALELTERWLATHGVKYDQLVMRSQSDNRKDTVIKEEYLRSIGLENILCCFDDLPHVAYHLRSLGLTCHLVTHYDTVRTDLVSHGEDK
ncbi:putative polynucleotide 5' kinase/3' phosphatase [Pectobacterium phage PPWS1]|uniref:Polynucleotide 5' kinase/3' phosphatase n=1 Tax=Pectobacterium phage PPWS1 TaxID=1685500 RepID=A0A0P0UWN3_9CAUD|nr:polynucleotide kinase [Pectobacterium phage PPWS1]BAS69544.1 putative polynucleotide 5' kinase/3' phosphatase [Pectobacterium phage PPWS1]